MLALETLSCRKINNSLLYGLLWCSYCIPHQLMHWIRLASSNPDPEINPEGGTILRDEDIRLLVTVVLVLMHSWRYLPRPLQRWLLSRTKQIRTDELTFDGLCFGILQLTIAAELAGLDGYQYETRRKSGCASSEQAIVGEHAWKHLRIISVLEYFDIEFWFACRCDTNLSNQKTCQCDKKNVRNRFYIFIDRSASKSTLFSFSNQFTVAHGVWPWVQTRCKRNISRA